MHATLTFQAIEEDTADEDLASIRTTANRIMEAHEKTAGTWIATGKELKRLKATLVKDIVLRDFGDEMFQLGEMLVQNAL